jgi:hypothetical protein
VVTQISDILLKVTIKNVPDLLLTSSNIISIVDVPSRIQNYSNDVIGDIFIGESKKNCIHVEPLIDGLPNHYAKLIVINYIELSLNCHNYKTKTAVISNDTAEGITVHLCNINLV